MYTSPMVYCELLHTCRRVTLFKCEPQLFSYPSQLSINLFVLPPICVEIHRFKVPIKTNKFRFFFLLSFLILDTVLFI